MKKSMKIKLFKFKIVISGCKEPMIQYNLIFMNKMTLNFRMKTNFKKQKKIEEKFIYIYTYHFIKLNFFKNQSIIPSVQTSKSSYESSKNVNLINYIRHIAKLKFYLK